MPNAHTKSLEFRIYELGCADTVIEATTFYKEFVFTRIADLIREHTTDFVETFIAADLYYHEQYLAKLKYVKKWYTIGHLLERGFRKGRAYHELSKSRNYFNKLDNNLLNFSNSNIRVHVLGESFQRNY